MHVVSCPCSGEISFPWWSLFVVSLLLSQHKLQSRQQVALLSHREQPDGEMPWVGRQGWPRPPCLTQAATRWRQYVDLRLPLGEISKQKHFYPFPGTSKDHKPWTQWNVWSVPPPFYDIASLIRRSEGLVTTAQLQSFSLHFHPADAKHCRK